MNIHVREICEFWGNYESRFVKINKKRLAAIAKQLKNERPKIPDWQTPELPSSSLAFVSHIFYICAVDFAFTHFEVPYRIFNLSPKISGSAASSMCFLRHFGNYPIDAQEMMAIANNESRLKRFFQGTNLPPLLPQRGINLAEAALVLKTKFDGNPLNLLEQSRYEADRLIEMLVYYFPIAFGSDHYQGLYPNKRAQLFPLIYHGRAVHSSGLLRLLKNPEDIGPIPDYQIPKYLRSAGILEYNKGLDQKISGHTILAYGSIEEMEIRLATIYAVCELMKLSDLTMPTLDNFLWTEGQKIKHLNHHLTPTTAY